MNKHAARMAARRTEIRLDRLILLLILNLLLLAACICASQMNSSNYAVTISAVSSGGTNTSSANYINNLVTGTVTGETNSSGYEALLGFWYGAGIANLPPNISTPTLWPTTPNTTSDIRCNATAIDNQSTTLTVEFRWYNGTTLVVAGNTTNVPNGTNSLISTLGNANTTKNDLWNCSVHAYDGTYYSSWQSANVNISNSPPVKLNLSHPLNYDQTYINRTPRFNWSNTTGPADPDNEFVNYNIQISLLYDFSSTIPYGNQTDLTGQNYTYPEPLPFGTYFWKVSANDSEGYGPFSDIFNFTLVRAVSITMAVQSVEFGTMMPNTFNDTTDNIPPPFKVENDGNVEINISINATAFFTSVSFNTSYYQFKANRTDEADSFDYANSITTWRNMSSARVLTIRMLNWTDTKDTVAVDLNVTVPQSEPPQSLLSNVTFWAEEGT